jgi:hypothetical protein
MVQRLGHCPNQMKHGLEGLNGRFSGKSTAQYWMQEGGADELITN